MYENKTPVFLDKAFWRKKTLVTFLMSVLVFFIHISYQSNNYKNTT